MLTLGGRIRQLREEKDISLRELAKTIGVSAPFLSDVELGRRHPSDQHIVDLARALGTTPEEMKKHDTRPPMRDLRRMTAADPQYGFAFRQLIEKKVTPEELLRFLKSREEASKGDDNKK